MTTCCRVCGLPLPPPCGPGRPPKVHLDGCKRRDKARYLRRYALENRDAIRAGERRRWAEVGEERNAKRRERYRAQAGASA